MDTAIATRISIESCRKSALKLVTKHYNDFFSVPKKIAFSIKSEGGILTSFNNLKIKNIRIKKCGYAKLYVNQAILFQQVMI